MATQNEDPRAALANLIAGRSDEEISAGIKAQGTDTVLDQIFQGMAEAFRPEAAQNANAVIQYDVATPDGPKSYQLNVGDGKCTSVRGKPAPAKVTLASDGTCSVNRVLAAFVVWATVTVRGDSVATMRPYTTPPRRAYPPPYPPS